MNSRISRTFATLLALATLTSATALTPITASTANAQAALQSKQAPISQDQIKLSFAPLVKKVAPAVVNIYTKRQVTVRYNRSPLFNDPFFNMFFDDRIFGGQMRQKVENSLGSGVIISQDGTIVTNAHVIKGAQEIKVILSDGREYSATITLQDDASDLALLQVDNPGGETLPTAPLKPSESLEVGDLVLAIGNPFGVGQSVSSGIVSAQGRSALDVNDYNFFIQTDAAINPGNSGGALVSMDGQVVGINTAIYSRDGGSLGIGFAIPSEMVTTLISAQASGSKGTNGITRPWLGVEAQAVTSDIAQSLGMAKPYGVLIANLHPASPLKNAGIKTGDVVTAMDGKRLRGPSEMKFRMATLALGNSAKLEVLRSGKSYNFDVRAIAPPNQPAANETEIKTPSPFQGATIANLNPAIASKLDLKDDTTQRVIITKAAPRSRVGRLAGVGDSIIAINGQTIKTVKDAAQAIKANQTGVWDITILSKKGRKQRIMLR